jgi:hypothetical protein
MNGIEEQKEIIERIYWLLRSSISEDSDSAKCEIRYERFEDGSSSIGGKASYTLGEEVTHCLLKYPDRRILDDAVPKLHAAMKAHTGGDWNAFTLFINEDGSVTTRFEYPDTPKGTG